MCFYFNYQYTICDLRSGKAKEIKWFHFAQVRCRKSPFCRAIEQENHAIVTGKDCKTGYHVVSALNLVKIVTPCSISFGFLAGPWWDSEIENLLPLAMRSH